MTRRAAIGNWKRKIMGILKQNKRRYGTEKATEGERITMASNLSLFVILACSLN